MNEKAHQIIFWGLVTVAFVLIFFQLTTSANASVQKESNRVVWIHNYNKHKYGKLIYFQTYGTKYLEGQTMRSVPKKNAYGYYWRLSRNKKTLIKAGRLANFRYCPPSGRISKLWRHQAGQRLKVKRGAIYEKLIFGSKSKKHVYWIWWGYMAKTSPFPLRTQ